MNLNKQPKNSEEFSILLRGLSLKMVKRAGSSHIGGILSMADIISVLYFETLNIFPEEPEHTNRDRLILSKGHCCAGIYAALAIKGFFEIKELDKYAENNSTMMAHISHKVPGVEFSTGSLGHGLPFGVGKALFAQKNQKDWHTYVVLSDGELDEGSNWEALLFASHHNLNSLTVVIDFNNLQSLDTIGNTLALEPLEDKFKAFGAHVIRLDGHNHDLLRSAFDKKHKTKPKVIIADTVKGKGVSFMENKVLWH
jgi:transketolase